MAETTISKRCSKCKQTKPLSEFYRDRSSKDSHQHRCKICDKIHQGAHYQTKKGKETNRRAARKYAQTQKGKISMRKRISHYNIRHPEQHKARNAVIVAIKKGQLPQLNTLLCHYDVKPAKQYHHWHGYAPEHRLDVIPVCQKCHNIITHKKNSPL